MGFVFSKMFSAIAGENQTRIIIIGLDNAGKTTILCKSFITSYFIHFILFLFKMFCIIDRLHLGEVEPTVPSK